MPEAIRRDHHEFATADAAQAVADALNLELPDKPFRVVSGSPHGDVFYVVAPDGTKARNPEPAPKVNPLRGIPDRFEPAPKPQGRGIEMVDDGTGTGRTKYVGSRNHGSRYHG